MKPPSDQELIRDYLRRNPRPAFRTGPPPMTTLEDRIGSELTPRNAQGVLDPIETEAKANYDNGFEDQKYDAGRVKSCP